MKKAAQAMRRILGREAVARGQHEGAGTAHVAVSLMESYLELVTAVDQAMTAGHPWVP